LKSRQIYSDVRIKEDDIGGVRGTRGGEINSYRDSMGKRETKSYLEDPVVDGRIVLKRTIKKQDGLTECI
jgi:hypothetical protein